MNRHLLSAAAFFTGATTMLAEIAAGRLVAPFYGTSTLVWSLLIGAVLASLTAGQLLATYLARRDRLTPAMLGTLLLASAAMLASLPMVARPLMSGTLGLFRTGSLGIMLASFVGVSLLLALPTIALGTCGPLLLHLATTDERNTGAAAGRLYALGTAGSLLGTYLSGLVLIPLIGTRSTLWLGACSIASLGALIRFRRASRVIAILPPLLLAIATFLLPASVIKPRKGSTFETESRHQFIQVTESSTLRSLYLNDGYAVQSVYPLDGSLYLRGVWAHYAFSPAWTTTGQPNRILLLGLGGGTSARTFRALLPNTQLTGVELDPDVAELGRRLFDLPNDMRVIVDDARAALSKPPLSNDSAPFDLILVDAFQFPYVPFQLCTVEFFRQLESRLSQGGALVLNIGRDQDARDLVLAIARTLGTVMPVIRAVDVPSHPNTILVATRHPVEADAGLASTGYSQATLEVLSRLPVAHKLPVPSEIQVLTDDHAPVEAITDRVIFRRLLSVVRRGGWT